VDEKERTLFTQVGKAFSPGAPVDKYSLFAGRTKQVRDIMNVVTQRGHHAILFGERGVGKTSLANVLSELLSGPKMSSPRSGTINCDGTDDFSSLWHKALRELSVNVNSSRMGFDKHASKEQVPLDSFLPDEATPDDVRIVLQRLDQPAIIIFDELDRLRNAEAKTLLADTIKTLSDHSVETTIVLVGVADSVDRLIAEHQSVERSLVQIPMPRMSQAELFQIIDKGLTEVGMKIDSEPKNEIARLSQGLPHFTHLLALHAAQTAVLASRKHIRMPDVQEAIRLAVDKAQQSVLSAYHKATSSPRKGTLYGKVLLACALATIDDLGYFAAADVREPLSRIMNKPMEIPAYSRHLNDFCEEGRGPILEKTGTTRRFRFRFVNPMLQPFVVIHGRAKGLYSP
jgi:Cdc6-like AAA superfamily ATPase